MAHRNVGNVDSNRPAAVRSPPEGPTGPHGAAIHMEVEIPVVAARPPAVDHAETRSRGGAARLADPMKVRAVDTRARAIRAVAPVTKAHAVIRAAVRVTRVPAADRPVAPVIRVRAVDRAVARATRAHAVRRPAVIRVPAADRPVAPVIRICVVDRVVARATRVRAVDRAVARATRARAVVRARTTRVAVPRVAAPTRVRAADTKAHAVIRVAVPVPMTALVADHAVAVDHSVIREVVRPPAAARRAAAMREVRRAAPDSAPIAPDSVRIAMPRAVESAAGVRSRRVPRPRPRRPRCTARPRRCR